MISLLALNIKKKTNDSPSESVEKIGNVKANILPSKDIFHLLSTPNPIVNTTIIEYNLLRSSTANLVVYDLYGQQLICLLNNQSQEAGTHQITYDASGLPAGIYFCTFQAVSEKGEIFKEVKKLVKVK